MLFHRFSSQSLKTRITLLTLLIVVFGFGVLGFYTKDLLRQELLTYTGAQQRSALRLLTSEVNHGLDKRIAALQAAALQITPELQQDAPALQDFLRQQLLLAGLFNGGLVVWNAQGQLQTELQSLTDALATPVLVQQDLTQVLAQGQPVIGQVQADNERKAAWFAMAVPVRGPTGAVLGALAGVIRLDQPNFLTRLTAHRYGESGNFFLVAAKQRLIFATSHQNRVLEVLPPVGASLCTDSFVQGHEGTTLSVDPKGVEVLVSTQQIPLARWYASVTLAPEETFALIDAVKWRARLVALALGLMCLGLIWFMLRRQLAPMTAAVQTLDGFVRQNQAPQALSVERNDEVGQLVAGFNRLLERLVQQQTVLHQRELFNQAVINSVSAGIAVLDQDGVILEVNDAWRLQEVNGTGTVDPSRQGTDVGGNFLLASAALVANQAGADAERAQVGIRAVLDGHSPRFYLEFASHLPQQERWYSMNVTPFVDADRRGAVVSLEDISLRMQMQNQVREMAFYDPLTKLPNRRLALERLSQQLVRARRVQGRLALLFIDLDKFKPINDELGHAVGDWLLQAVAERILGCVRASDTAARIGGDEFVVLLPDLQSTEAAISVAEKIRHALAQEFVTEHGVALKISSSIGVALYPDHGANEQDLLRLGDEAMYFAKKQGRNAVHLCNPLVVMPGPDAEATAAHAYVHLRWKDAFNTGNAELDSEHQALFVHANTLLDTVALRRQQPLVFKAAYDALLAHTAAHFAREEALLRTLGFASLPHHAQQHQKLLIRARTLYQELQQAPDETLAEGKLIRFLVSELVAGHLLKADREFSTLFINPT